LCFRRRQLNAEPVAQLLDRRRSLALSAGIDSPELGGKLIDQLARRIKRRRSQAEDGLDGADNVALLLRKLLGRLQDV
jgi:hypothetical protein